MKEALAIAQIITGIIVTILILLQQRGGSLGSAFGGEGGEFYVSRRGAEKKIFWATIVLGVIFIALTLANLLLT